MEGGNEYKVTLVIGVKVVNYRFPDKETFEKYHADVSQIRAVNSGIKANGGLERLPKEEFRRRVTAWIKLCDELKTKWGDELVPFDVTNAWNDAVMVLATL